MWICFNDGFISAVQDWHNPHKLMVRSRRYEILETLFPDEDIQIGGGSDYKYRVFVEKEKVAEIVKNRLLDVNYGNFKNSVKDNDLHTLYARFWHDHYDYQL